MRKEKSNIKEQISKITSLIFVFILLFSTFFLLKTSYVIGEQTTIKIIQQCTNAACTTGCVDISRQQAISCTVGCNASTKRLTECITETCNESISTCGSGGCASNEKRVCYLNNICSYACQCVDYPICVPTQPPTNPTATPVPPAATATPVPARPALCQSATISKTSLAPGESLTITSTANTSDIKTFTYAFYNLDNLYGPNNPKPIFFTANTHYVRSDSTTPPVNPPSHTTTVTYNDLNKPDLNWNSQKPIKIQVNGYFTNSAGGFSLPDARCVVKFNITLASPTATPTSTVPTPTINPACVCGTGDLCDATNCTFDKFAAPITYANPIKCSLSDSLFPTVPSTANKTSWCQAGKRTKGDADGNGIINTTDYFYYVAAVNGGKIPVTVNPDFNGDAEVGVTGDRVIIIKSLNP